MTRRSARLQSRLFSLSLRIHLSVPTQSPEASVEISIEFVTVFAMKFPICVSEFRVCVYRFADLVDAACNNSGIRLTTPGFVEVLNIQMTLLTLFLANERQPDVVTVVSDSDVPRRALRTYARP